MFGRIIVVLAGALAIAAIAAGCGGGDGGADDGASTTAEGTTGGNDDGASTTAEGTTGGDGGGGDNTAGGDSSGGDGTTGGDSSGGDGGSTTAEGTTSSGGDGGSTASLTKAAFIKQGDAICEKVPDSYAALLKALEKELNKTSAQMLSGKGKEEANLKAGVPPLRVAVEEFEELGAPEGEEQQAQAIVDALVSAADGLEENPAGELSGPKSSFAEFNKLTGEYGFGFCSAL